jgi:hypothetical protein
MTALALAHTAARKNAPFSKWRVQTSTAVKKLATYEICHARTHRNYIYRSRKI